MIEFISIFALLVRFTGRDISSCNILNFLNDHSTNEFDCEDWLKWVFTYKIDNEQEMAALAQRRLKTNKILQSTHTQIKYKVFQQDSIKLIHLRHISSYIYNEQLGEVMSKGSYLEAIWDNFKLFVGQRIEDLHRRHLSEADDFEKFERYAYIDIIKSLQLHKIEVGKMLNNIEKGREARC
jgi:hypothetical protein